MADTDPSGGTSPGGAGPGPGRALEYSWRGAVGAELFWIEETCSCATLCQEETARVWRALNICLAVSAVLASGVAGSMMLAGNRHEIVAGGLALGAALLSALLGMLGPARREGQANESAEAFQEVQAMARQARQVDLQAQYFEQARESLAALTDRWQAVNRSAVPVSRWARLRIRKQTVASDAAEERMAKRLSMVGAIVPPPRAADQIS
ncbi:SLATT domain-containing protein [Actinomadura rudentiformis]|uniref:SLATT domain-containing protein n=1 Tax=Actinomadura rudentiformis TaxID=359158 RepID=A0A6H9Z4T4_9ACTN|nr:SLATT domain-containing protein [Actinomadura rudentiformis]KAB2350961.1 SLATT domain-containing protein [Actinomadura rudentiformis]